MPRIFASLAAATLILFALAAAATVLNAGRVSDRHVLIALCGMLLSCFTQVAGFTYLTVTGKVVMQAVHLAGLDQTRLEEIKGFKRSFTRHLAVAIVLLCLASATGGAAWRSPDGSLFQVPVAMLVLAAHLGVFLRQHRLIRRNATSVEATLRDYAAWRNQRRVSDATPAVGERVSPQ